MKTIISWTFLIYLLVLIAERLQSIIRVIKSEKKFFETGFSGYVNTLSLISIAGTIILLAGRFFLRLLYDPSQNLPFSKNFYHKSLKKCYTISRNIKYFYLEFTK